MAGHVIALTGFDCGVLWGSKTQLSLIGVGMMMVRWCRMCAHLWVNRLMPCACQVRPQAVGIVFIVHVDWPFLWQYCPAKFPAPKP